MPLGDIGAQITHAAGESAWLFGAPLPKDTFAVILQTPNEEGLLKLEQKLAKHGIEFCAVREPDAPFNNAITAIGIKPQLKSEVSKLLANLPLLKE